MRPSAVINFDKTASMFLFIAKWLENGQCGPNNLLPNGLIGECNPQSNTPCCDGNKCGSTDEYCKINDYRVVYFGKFLIKNWQ